MLHFLIVQCDPWKMYFTVRWRINDTSAYTNCLNSSQRGNPEKFYSIILIPDNVINTEFWSVLYSKPLQEYGNPNITLEAEYGSRSMTTLQEGS